MTKTFTLTVSNPVCSQSAFLDYQVVYGVYGDNTITVGDFNKDGFQDLIAANNNFTEIHVDTGNGTGAFGLYTFSYLSDKSSSIAVGDINGDGLQDVALANFEVNKVSFLIGDILGGFKNYPNGYAYNPFITVGTKPVSVVFADFNGVRTSCQTAILGFTNRHCATID